ncbi:MAG TPA: glycoside hydrolase family 5 protein [Ktedonobacterales bacterium]
MFATIVSKRVVGIVVGLLLPSLLLGACSNAASPIPSPTLPPPPAITGFLHTQGGQLVDSADQEVHLTGVNWFGFETDTFAPHGLWARNWREMLAQIASAGFNTIRLPYSNQLFDPASAPQSIDYQINPDLQGLRGLALMDTIIQGAGKLGLKVILDQHRPDAQGQSGLWYTDNVPESRWISDWVMLAQQYQGNPTVIGADLHNEPHSPATWGDGNPATDWRLAAERAGNAILAVNPDWLIIVEGTEQYQGDSYWWGGNLEGAADYPVRLSEPDKLVYSAHDYGPGVSNQPWFHAPDFPQNLPAIWERQWAYLQLEGKTPILLGEFGGRSMGLDTEGIWQRSLVSYLKQYQINYTYWAWNADSVDTGGLLEPDWKTLDAAKMDVLSAYQWPILPTPPPQTNRPDPADISDASPTPVKL